jgi:hypothetical protein
MTYNKLPGTAGNGSMPREAQAAVESRRRGEPETTMKTNTNNETKITLKRSYGVRADAGWAALTFDEQWKKIAEHPSKVQVATRSFVIDLSKKSGGSGVPFSCLSRIACTR